MRSGRKVPLRSQFVRSTAPKAQFSEDGWDARHPQAADVPINAPWDVTVWIPVDGPGSTIRVLFVP
jgi:hypothetical protein